MLLFYSAKSQKITKKYFYEIKLNKIQKLKLTQTRHKLKIYSILL